MKNDVSLWLGNFGDFDEVENYTKVMYNDDGDSIPSVFEKEFKLGYYDRSLIEKDWIPEAEDDIKELLVDFSYDDQLIKQFNDIQLNSKYNTIILIYNYNYEKDGLAVNSVDKDEYTLQFIGTVEYVD
ncbi:immunity 22 family protein [Bacillus safensis]|uniref:immunity 22 family protein n=1 Tax=Bacillus safensis TaxID=561879 RepID=UPI001BA6A4FE|nr:immunity 22 family protein [Bacillus safensis]MBR0606357.1 immunity 22 family protein [Bacillus safensis]MCY7569234.1 immunity 22 family protein [Bacillus safensis]WJE40829.1 immunity 22 family protein [Bacillus safensis]